MWNDKQEELMKNCYSDLSPQTVTAFSMHKSVLYEKSPFSIATSDCEEETEPKYVPAIKVWG